MILFPLEVKRSPIDGQGLFARCAIPRRRKIGELTGEMITILEARRRAGNQQRIRVVELDDAMALDGEKGNEFKYINHSCSPNTFVRVCRGHVEFYALCGIESGEELTCNYERSYHEGSLDCRCQSKNCGGRL